MAVSEGSRGASAQPRVAIPPRVRRFFGPDGLTLLIAPEGVKASNASLVLALVLFLAEDWRILVAADFLRALDDLLKAQGKRLAAVRNELEDPAVKRDVSKLRQRAVECRGVVDSASPERAQDWTYACTRFGVETRYKPDPDGTLWIKLDGEIEGVPLFEQLAVVRETALFDKWAPFVNKSNLVSQLAMCEVVTYFNVNVPLFGLSRDAVVHAYACDSVWEEGRILMVGQSVDEATAPELNSGEKLPEFRKTLFHDRMLVRGFQALIEIQSPTKAHTTIIANFDPKAALPQSIINFATKNMAGILLHVLQDQGKVVAEDPDSAHAVRIREETWFYRDWLVPRFQKYCAREGWLLPPIVALTGADEAHEAGARGKKKGIGHRLAKSRRKLFKKLGIIVKPTPEELEQAEQERRAFAEAEGRSVMDLGLRRRFDTWARNRDRVAAKEAELQAHPLPSDPYRHLSHRIAEVITLPLVLLVWSGVLSQIHTYGVERYHFCPERSGVGPYLLLTLALATAQALGLALATTVTFRLLISRRSHQMGTLDETALFMKRVAFALGFGFVLIASVAFVVLAGAVMVGRATGLAPPRLLLGDVSVRKTIAKAGAKLSGVLPSIAHTPGAGRLERIFDAAPEGEAVFEPMSMLDKLGSERIREGVAAATEAFADLEIRVLHGKDEGDVKESANGTWGSAAARVSDVTREAARIASAVLTSKEAKGSEADAAAAASRQLQHKFKTLGSTATEDGPREEFQELPSPWVVSASGNLYGSAVLVFRATTVATVLLVVAVRGTP